MQWQTSTLEWGTLSSAS